MKVIIDVVVNHTGDIIQLSGGGTYSDAPYRDCNGRCSTRRDTCSEGASRA
jgi:glycosidase